MTGPDRSGPAGDRKERWGYPRLTRRAEFQRVGKGQRWHSACFTLQGARRPETGDLPSDEPAASPPPRIGITVTRKVGGAVARNRIRRRLRAALAVVAPRDPGAPHDFVIVARRDVLAAPFAGLRTELATAFDTLDARLRAPRPAAKRRRTRDGGDPPHPT